jgi:osmotically-inducible protein OsmY
MKSNIEIRGKVLNELKKYSLLATSNIGVHVLDNIVFLSGKVDFYRKKYDAGKLIRIS